MTLAKLPLYARLMRLDKPIGIYLLLWPTLWGVWIAGEGQPSALVLLIFILGVIFMRSAGCVINDYADRDFDGHVERTKQRPLATGEVSTKEALTLFAALGLVSFVLVLFLNWQTLALSVVGIFLAILYPFTKRFTNFPQFFLGAAFAWAIPMAFMAETTHIPNGAWLLFAATLIFAVVYDTMYAMVDREDDLKIGVKSTAVLFGDYDRLIIGMFQLIFFGLLVAAGLYFKLGLIYDFFLLIAMGIAAYHQWLIRKRDRQACFKAFLHNHWLAFIIFVGIVLDYAVKPYI